VKIRLCWAVASLLLLVSVGLTYKFVFQGTAVQSADGRTVIYLEQAELDLVLGEMRSFLESVQVITAGVSNNNMQMVAAAARRVGRAAAGAVPGSVMGKLPLGFKQLGRDTHGKFDQLALYAGEFGEPGPILEQLAALMQNCVGCHAAFSFAVGDPK